jgi:prepilin-type N-terminal cleavage/methylation domain-containing protein/prepilin-type processing-associated H-X9-DG protein
MGSGDAFYPYLQCRRRGLTLVELLVVTAILATLASLLLPALHQPRGLTRRTSCTARLKQIAQAFGLYAQDHDDALPANDGGHLDSLTAVDRLWIWQLYPYVRNAGVFHCPADPITNARRTLSGSLREEWDRPGLPALSYGANWELLSRAAQGDVRVRVGLLSHPAHRLLVSDCTERWAFGPLFVDPQGVRWSHIAYANGPPEDHHGVSDFFHGGRSGRGHERHSAGSQVAFLDGHVAYLAADRFENRVRLLKNPQSGRLNPVLVQRPVVSPLAVPPEAEPEQ